jgi:two-component system, chemotaxis family, protein-glutamate methylesterase/glutaminase
MALRVLVADDSLVFRRAISDALAAIPDVQVVGSAPNGKIAVQKVLDLKPDLLTLDMEMPELDGLAVLQALKDAGSTTSVMVISSVTMRGGRLTMQALERGAFDFLTKPQGKDAAESRAMMIREMSPRLRALAHRRQIRDILRPSAPAAGSGVAHAFATPAPAASPMSAPATRSQPSRLGPAELVLIGVSTGGPAALAKLLPLLPADLGVPIAIVQHMPPIFTQSLAESLSIRCNLQVREAADGDKLLAGQVLIAPGGRQMRLVAAPDAVARVQITDDPPENNCRPAVDYMFRSVATNLPGRAMAVILTGMGSDGTLGLRLLRRHGCFTIAQDEATSVVFGMPKAAIDAGLADLVLPVDAIAARILSAVKGRGS